MYSVITMPGRQSHINTSFSVVSGAYVGPGNAISAGATSWYGLRAYTAASIGTKPVIRLRRDSDNTEHDFSTVTGGVVDLQNILAFKGSANLFVTKLYDQVSTLDLPQATAATQATFSFNVTNGSLPSIKFLDGHSLVRTGVTAVAQPWSMGVLYMSLVASLGTAPLWLTYDVSNDPGFYTDITANTIGSFISAAFTTEPATDNVPHSVLMTATGANSKMYVDGTQFTAENAATGMRTAISIGDDGNNTVNSVKSNFYWFEGGIWNVAVSQADDTALFNNQRTYWGF